MGEPGVYRSTDNGGSWAQAGLTGMQVYSLAVNSSGKLFAGTGGGVFESTDRGATWIPLGLRDSTIYCLAIDSSDNIYAGYYTTSFRGGVARSTDGGTTWADVSEGLLGTAVFALAVLPDGNVVAGLRSGGIYIRQVGANSWSYALPANWVRNINITCLTADATGTVAAGTEGYGVFISTNGGRCWSQPIKGLRQSSFYAVAIDSGDVFAGSYGDGVFKLARNDSVWVNLKSGMIATMVEALGVKAPYVFAGTEGGGVFHSTDLGGSWTQDTVGMDFPYVRALAVTPKGDIFAGTGGGLYRSSDNGASWRRAGGRAGLDSTVACTCIAVDRRGVIFVGTDHSGVFRSTDNGSSWLQANNGLSSPFVRSIAADSAGVVYASTFGGIFKSTDGGESWLQVSASPVGMLAVKANGYIFAGAIGEGIRRSTDGGSTWVQVNNGLGDSYQRGITLLWVGSKGEIYAGSGRGQVFRSTNDGDSWLLLGAGLAGVWVLSLAVDSSGYLFAGTEGAGVFRSTQPVTGIAETGVWMRRSFVLNQNCPNPFNPSTTISFDIPQQSHVKLVVYDVLGREVRTLVDEEKEPGRYSVTFDASDLPTGVYLYRLSVSGGPGQASSFSEMRKMLVVR